MDKKNRNPEREAWVTAAVNNSPFYKHVSMRVTQFNDRGSVMEMDLIPELKNVWGTVHGGAISSLVDSSCGTAIGPFLEPDETVVTLDLRVQLFKPGREGKLTAHGRVVHCTKRHVMTECEVTDDDGDVVARGNTIHILIRKKP